MLPQNPEHYSGDLARVINSLLQVNPRARPSCDQILQVNLVKGNAHVDHRNQVAQGCAQFEGTQTTRLMVRRRLR